MRRADRLLELAGYLRDGGLVTAESLAQRLEVSVRTVYRDIAALQAQGFAIEGQAGMGYMLRAPLHLPPLTFDHDELEALALGLAYVLQVGDPALAAAARAARAKIDLAWSGQPVPGVGSRPLRSAQRPERRAPAFAAALRAAVRARRLVRFRYRDAAGAETERQVRPLALAAFSDGWLLIGWCLLRQDFRLFRLDRLTQPEVLADRFPEEPERELPAYLARRGGPPEPVAAVAGDPAAATGAGAGGAERDGPAAPPRPA